MNLNSIKSAITSKAGRHILRIQKNSPVILFAAGVVGVVGATVLACRATLRMDDILVDMEEDLEKARTLEHAEYSEQDRQRDIILIYTKAVGKIAKVYAPAIILGGLSIAALTGSHVVLSKRNLAMTAAYAALDKGFREYRDRVIQELGPDKDKEFRYELVDREVIEEDPKGGTKVTNVRVIGPKGASIYARCFDDTNSNWNKTPQYNQFFIQCQQNYANDLLHARGHVFLNDVYDMLGMARTTAGAVVGWVKGNGDNFIDFGVFEGNKYAGMQFVMGNERSIWLDFNVDGVVYDKI